MARNGLAQGANKGFATDAIERKARPARSKGVSFDGGWYWRCIQHNKFIYVQSIELRRRKSRYQHQDILLIIKGEMRSACYNFVEWNMQRMKLREYCCFRKTICIQTRHWLELSLFISVYSVLESVPPSAVKLPEKWPVLPRMKGGFSIWSKPEEVQLTREFTNLPRGVSVATSVLWPRGRISRVSTRRCVLSKLEHKQ